MDIGPIRIEVEALGSLRLRWLHSDLLSDAERLLRSHSDPLDFATHIVSAALLEPDEAPSDVKRWGTETLERVIVSWGRHQFSLGKDLSSEPDILEAFKLAVDQLVQQRRESLERIAKVHATAPWTRALQDAMRLQRHMVDLSNIAAGKELVAAQEAIRQATAWMAPVDALVQNVQRQFDAVSEATRGIQGQIDAALEAARFRQLAGLFRHLPDPAELIERAGRVGAGIDALEGAGYGFTAHLLNLPFVVELGTIQGRVRGAVATNVFAAYTRDPSFVQELQRLVESTPVFRRRWPIIAEAIEAHHQRRYAIAIPALLAQVEGFINDVLVLRGEAAPYRKRLYARDESGKVKKDRNGKPIKLTGLDKKLAHSRWKKDEVLVSISSIIADQLLDDRNAILHGRSHSYAKAKLSTQCILILWVLAVEVHEQVG